MSNSDSIPVLVWRVHDKSERGHLHSNQGKIYIQLESGEVLQGKKSEPITFDIRNMISLSRDGGSSLISIKEKYRVHLNPASVILHPYAFQSGQFIGDVFPLRDCALGHFRIPFFRLSPLPVCPFTGKK